MYEVVKCRTEHQPHRVTSGPSKQKPISKHLSLYADPFSSYLQKQFLHSIKQNMHTQTSNTHFWRVSPINTALAKKSYNMLVLLTILSHRSKPGERTINLKKEQNIKLKTLFYKCVQAMRTASVVRQQAAHTSRHLPAAERQPQEKA